VGLRQLAGGDDPWKVLPLHQLLLVTLERFVRIVPADFLHPLVGRAGVMEAALEVPGLGRVPSLPRIPGHYHAGEPRILGRVLSNTLEHISPHSWPGPDQRPASVGGVRIAFVAGFSAILGGPGRLVLAVLALAGVLLLAVMLADSWRP
jgi:hypothetical protein